MSYIIATYKDDQPYAVTTCNESMQFKLIPLNSNMDLTKSYSHPYRAGAYNILSWINSNDEVLAQEDLDVYDEQKFYK